MGATLRSVSYAKNNNGGALTIAAPAGIADGDELLAIIWQDTDGTIANLGAPTGWAQVGSDIAAISGSPYAKVFDRRAASEPASYDWPTSTNASTVGIILCYDGATVDPDTPIRVDPVGNSGSGTVMSAGSITVDAGDALIVSFSTQSGSTSWSNQTAGLVEQVDQSTAWVAAVVYTHDDEPAGPTGTSTADASASSTTGRGFAMAIAAPPAIQTGSGAPSSTLALTSMVHAAPGATGAPTSTLALASATTGHRGTHPVTALGVTSTVATHPATRVHSTMGLAASVTTGEYVTSTLGPTATLAVSMAVFADVASVLRGFDTIFALVPGQPRRGRGVIPVGVPLPELVELGYSLDDFAFGRGSVYAVESVDFGTASMTTNDVARSRDDGLVFGRDLRTSRTVTITGNILTAPGHTPALDALATMQAAWRDNAVREIPGATSVLRWRRGGRARRIYGRPRRFSSTSRRTQDGWIPFTAEFVTADDLFYDDDEWANTVSIIPPDSGGITTPIMFPLSTLAVAQAPGEIFVGGTTQAWVYFIIRGPIANPVIDVVGEWSLGLNLTLKADQSVAIDPRPWARGVRLDGATNVAGTMTPTSPRLSQLRLAPGRWHEIVLSGADPTGTASLTVGWRDTYSSY